MTSRVRILLLVICFTMLFSPATAVKPEPVIEMPDQVSTGEEFQVSSLGTEDPDGGEITSSMSHITTEGYEDTLWNVDGLGAETYSFQEPGEYTVRLYVEDDEDESAETTRNITVADGDTSSGNNVYKKRDVFMVEKGEKFRLEGFDKPLKVTELSSGSFELKTKNDNGYWTGISHGIPGAWKSEAAGGFLLTCGQKNGRLELMYLDNAGVEEYEPSWFTDFCDWPDDKQYEVYFDKPYSVDYLYMEAKGEFKEVNVDNSGIVQKEIVFKRADGSVWKRKTIQFNMTGTKEVNSELMLEKRHIRKKFGDEPESTKKIEIWVDGEKEGEAVNWVNWKKDWVPETSDCKFNGRPRTDYVQAKPNRILDSVFYAWQSCVASNQKLDQETLSDYNDVNQLVKLNSGVKPVAAFEAPSEVLERKSFSLDASPSKPPKNGEIESYSWNLDKNGEKITHKFNEPGNHSVKLTVTSKQGIQSSITKNIHVVPNQYVERNTDISTYVDGVVKDVEEMTEIKFGSNNQNSLFVRKFTDKGEYGSMTAFVGSKGGEKITISGDKAIKGVEAEFKSGKYNIFLCSVDETSGDSRNIGIGMEGTYFVCFDDEKGNKTSYKTQDYKIGEIIEIRPMTKLEFGEENKNVLFIKNFTYEPSIKEYSLEGYANKIKSSQSIIPVAGTYMDSNFYTGKFYTHFCSYDRAKGTGKIIITAEEKKPWKICKTKKEQTPDGTVRFSSKKYVEGESAEINYDIIQKGSYRLEVGNRGEQVENRDIGKTESSGDITIGDLRSGNITARLIAPGTWWNPLDNARTVSMDTAKVKKLECTYNVKGKVENALKSDVPRNKKRVYSGEKFTTLTSEGTFGWTVTEDCGEELQLVYTETGQALTARNVSLPEQGGTVDGITLRVEAQEDSPGGEKPVEQVIKSCSFQRSGYHAAGINVDGPRVTATLKDNAPFNSARVVWKSGEKVLAERSGVTPGTALPAEKPDLSRLETGTHQLNTSVYSDGEKLSGMYCGEFTKRRNLQPEISISRENPEINQEVSFTAYPEGDYSYNWDLNNDNQYEQDGRTASTEFSEPGMHNITLKISGGGREAVRHRSIEVQNPKISSSLKASKDEISMDERLQIEYRTTEDVARNGYRVVISNPSGEEVYSTSSGRESGQFTFTPGQDVETGVYTAELVAKEGFLSSILRTIFGSEARDTFKIIKESTELSTWQEKCKEKGYSPTTSSGRASCIEEFIGPSCFKENPGNECVKIGDSVCEYYLGKEFNPETGKCGENK